MCCAHGSTLVGFQSYCKHTTPDGGSCRVDEMCSEQSFCKGDGALGGEKGVCTAKLATNAKCTGLPDSACQSGSCANANANSDGKDEVCCSPLGSTYVASKARTYCRGQPHNAPCYSDAMCTPPTTCTGDALGLQQGICGTQLGTGAACEHNAECLSLACGRANSTISVDGPLICCGSGYGLDGALRAYCKDMPNGTACKSDFQVLPAPQIPCTEAVWGQSPGY